MPEQGERETVSVEAHQRVVQERDELKAKIEELSKVATDVAKLNAAYDHFRGKQVPDPYGLAQAAIQNVTVRDADGDDLPARLDGWFDERVRMFGSPQPEPEVSSEKKPEDAPPASPRPSAAGPNPAASGEPVTVGGRLRPGDAEYKEVLDREGIAGIRRLESEGRVERHPDNPYRTAH